MQTISIKNHVIYMVECGISPDELKDMPCKFHGWPQGLAHRLRMNNIIRNEGRTKDGYLWNRGDYYPSFMKYYKENKRELNKILKRSKKVKR